MFERWRLTVCALIPRAWPVSTAVRLDDPQLFRFPFLYAVEGVAAIALRGRMLQ